MRKSIIPALLALLLVACAREAPDDTPPGPSTSGNTITYAAGKAPALATATATVEKAAPLRLNGRLTWDEDRTVRVYTPFAGRVVRISARAGDSVRQGQVLAVLASPEFGQAQAEARRADADLALAEKTLERQKELEGYGVAPRKDLQAAQADYARAQAESERARARVKLYGSSGNTVDQTFAIASPIPGVVVERNLNPGQELRPDQMTSNAPPPFVVTNPSYLWAILDASETDLPYLAPGTPITIRSPVYKDAEFHARVAAISDFLDPQTRTLKVRAVLENGDRRLKAEMFITAQIQTQRRAAIQIPASALFFEGGKRFVFTREGENHYTRREITTAEENQGKVVVVSGLEQGQVVVTEGVLMLQQLLQPRRVQK
jgi:cobalt-zinc-cadmium efflux system membrane fusion protein